MKTLHAHLLTEAPHPGAFPRPGLPEIAVVGRSNSGKSTLINTLVGVRNLARVARRPGKTRSLVFFSVEDRFLLVDLPGYGFAQAPKQEQARWRLLVDAYFRGPRPLRSVLALFDIRRDPDDLDLALLALLARFGIPWRAVWTKADKLAKRDVESRGQVLDGALGVMEPGLAFSGKTRMGREELLAWIEQRAR